jgi:hypothetical protein
VATYGRIARIPEIVEAFVFLLKMILDLEILTDCLDQELYLFIQVLITVVSLEVAEEKITKLSAKSR